MTTRILRVAGVSAFLLVSGVGTGLAGAATISLAWNPNPPGTATGYRLSWGNASGQYSQTIDVGNATTATIVPPAANRIYYFVVRAYNGTGVSSPSTEVAAWYGSTSLTPLLARTGDFDGDGKADPMVYRGNTGQWFMSGSRVGPMAANWGAPALGDVPVPADFDGDGKKDVAIYRGTTGQWFISLTTGGSRTVAWGAPSLQDLPVPDDYDGDGKVDVAVFRRTTGEWLILKSTNGLQRKVSWGGAGDGDIPVPGDYDGNGAADLVVYRRATGQWFVLFDNLTTATWNWGSSALADVPVPADYDGDGAMDFGVFRQASGTWLLHLSATNGSKGVVWGSPSLGDIPIPSDFDGDGKADIGIYRASTGAWYIAYAAGGSTSFSFGAPSMGDTMGGVSQLAVIPL